MRGDGRRKSAVTDSVTENIPSPVARPVVRVKRRGKSPPPGAQATGHDKPRVVQDRTEDTRRLRPLRKERNPRVIVAPRSRGPSLSRAAAEKWSSGGLRAADRIRLRIGHQNRRGHPKGCPRRLVCACEGARVWNQITKLFKLTKLRELEPRNRTQLRWDATFGRAGDGQRRLSPVVPS